MIFHKLLSYEEPLEHLHVAGAIFTSFEYVFHLISVFPPENPVVRFFTTFFKNVSDLYLIQALVQSPRSPRIEYFTVNQPNHPCHNKLVHAFYYIFEEGAQPPIRILYKFRYYRHNSFSIIHCQTEKHDRVRSGDVIDPFKSSPSVQITPMYDAQSFPLILF